jgi:hypothetical protein
MLANKLYPSSFYFSAGSPLHVLSCLRPRTTLSRRWGNGTGRRNDLPSSGHRCIIQCLDSRSSRFNAPDRLSNATRTKSSSKTISSAEAGPSSAAASSSADSVGSACPVRVRIPARPTILLKLRLSMSLPRPCSASSSSASPSLVRTRPKRGYGIYWRLPIQHAAHIVAVRSRHAILRLTGKRCDVRHQQNIRKLL